MPPFIEISSLSKRFGDQWVIRGLSLTVDEGEIVVFQGPSGVGKSTFLRCLAGLEPFQEGRMRVGPVRLEAGMDMKKSAPLLRELHHQVGFVFQFFNLFPHLSVMENLTLGPVKALGQTEEQAREEAAELLRRVGLAHKADARPAALSGGQQQRVGIARALAMRPRAVLFDEPTSSLDPAMKAEIVDVMEDFARDGLAMLIVTHEPAVLSRMAARVVEFGLQCAVASDRPRP
ncbi:MAG: amino acid ABC transporter ATP-binding protein [Elusimicrobiota bacterium]